MQNGVKTVNDNGDEHWLLDGKWHRLDGPALTLGPSEVRGNTTYTAWYVNGVRHRLDGPAVTLNDPVHGYEIWIVNGKRHRLDGPAVINANGTKEFYLNGKRLVWADWRKKTKVI